MPHRSDPFPADGSADGDPAGVRTGMPHQRPTVSSPFGVAEGCVVFGVVTAGCMLLALGATLPPLWARPSGELADAGLRFVATGMVTLASLFLPVWAGHWRIASVSVLAAWVFILLAAHVEGSPTTQSIGTGLRALGVLATFATIWGLGRRSGTWRSLIWLSSIGWTLGAPLLTALAAES